MKKIYPTLLSFFALFSVNAQLTQSNHAPANGDQYAVWQCDSVGPGASGAGAVWNFASVATHSSLSRTYLASAVSSATYVNAAVAVGSSATDVSYYNSSPGDLVYYGGNLPIPSYSVSINYTTSPAIYAVYPMSMGTMSTAVIGGSINVTVPTALSGPFTGSSKVEADGNGSLTLPGGVTYSNVLRVVVSQTISATIIIPVTVTQETYQYYTPGIKAPIFSIATTTFAPSFGSASTQTIVTRNQAAVGTPTTPIDTTSVKENVENNVTLAVFPNPASGITTIEASGTKARQALVFDVTGKLINKINFNDGKATLDVSEYNNGLYLYTVIGKDGAKLGSGRITVIH